MLRESVLILMCIIMAGCATTYHGLQPISPSKSDRTSDLRPTFKWQASETKDAKYDIIIYHCDHIGSLPVPGARMYYRENIDRPEHKIEIDLIRGGQYLWSVRERLGERVGEWSHYDFNNYQYGRGNNWLYQLIINK
jgi:hypothetical protein